MNRKPAVLSDLPTHLLSDDAPNAGDLHGDVSEQIIYRDHAHGRPVIPDDRGASHPPPRAVVRGQLQRAADLHCVTVGDVMTRDPLVLPIELEVTEAIEALTARAVRHRERPHS